MIQSVNYSHSMPLSINYAIMTKAGNRKLLYCSRSRTEKGRITDSENRRIFWDRRNP